MRTRLAPTPSGFLHLGNAANLLVISTLADREHGDLALRIDDIDAPRARAEYVDDIFRTLAWLGITWTMGPLDTGDQQRHHRMAARTTEFAAVLEELHRTDVQLFTCACSRRELVRDRCIAGCASHPYRGRVPDSAVRIRLPDVHVEVDGTRVSISEVHGDPVIWRRDDTPSYHLMTVAEDRRMGMTDVIRGADLLESSALHRWVGQRLGAPQIAYRHHALITRRDGTKLSKSQGATSPLTHDSPTRRLVESLADELRASLGPGQHRTPSSASRPNR